MKKNNPSNILNTFQNNMIQKILTNIVGTLKRKAGLAIMTISVFFMAHSSLTAQCSGDVTLITQAEVDAFSCTTFTGNLTISGNAITNINSLSTLTSVSGVFLIQFNSNLSNLNSLSSLNSVGQLGIFAIQNLSDLGGLSGLTSANGGISISQNPNLMNLDGLSGVTSASGGISISQNPNLMNLNGLAGITTSVDALVIDINNSLSNLAGLAGITSVGGIFSISANPNLSNLDGLNALTSVGGGFGIQDNSGLSNLDGLTALTSIGDMLVITDNPGLSNLNGLNALTSVGSDLIIFDASSLNDLTDFCGLYPLLNGGGPTGSYNVFNNGLNPSQQQIIDAGPCPCSGTITLTTQTEVDAFSCTTFTGNLTIGGNNITNLSALSSLASVSGDLTIYSNTALTNVDGLSSLTSVGGDLDISSNPSLTNVDSLSSLTSVGERLEIESNAALTDVDGLSSLTSVGSSIIGYNAALTNVDGLSALSSVDEFLVFTSNTNLTDVDGLSSLTSVGKNIFIKNNTALTNLDGLTTITSVGGDLFIGDNPLLNDLVDFCGLYPLLNGGGLTGNYDVSSNGINPTQQQIIDSGACPPPCSLPTITCPANNLNLPSGCNPTVPAADISLPTVTEGCGTVTVTHQGDAIADVGCTRTVTRTYRATDDNGDFAECTQIFTFTVDTDGPTLSAMPASTTVACNAIPTAPTITATDACVTNPSVSFTEVDNVDPCDGGIITRTWSSTDDCNNNTSHMQTITVNPPPPPSISCPGDQVVTCFEDINADPSLVTASSLCGTIVAVYVKQPLITGGLPGCDGTVYTYTYKAVDDCGRSSECEQQFLIQNNAPTVTVIPGTTVDCFADIVVSESDATVITDCAGDYTLDIISPIIDEPLCFGSQVTYTYRVKDFCNRIVEVDRVFTIENLIGPIITSIPLNATVECGGGPNLSLFIAESLCGGEMEYAVSDPVVSGTPGCPGSTIAYTYSAIDECGRIAQHTQFLTIQNEGPIIDCPETLQIFGCQDGATDDLIDAWIASVTATASCGGELTVSNNYNGNYGMCINNGFTTVTFFTTDQCGRSSSCVGTIVIVDTEAPIIYEAPQEVLVPCNGVTQDIFDAWLANQGGAEAIDGCWGNDIFWSMNPSNPSLNCAEGPQAIVVEFIATDGCGNSASTTGIFNTKVHPNTVSVSGQIMTEEAVAVAEVEIEIEGGNAGMPDMEYTNETGGYGLPEFDYEDNLSVVPTKNDNPLNGISTYDLILLQKHILNIHPLSSPYKRIAADINRDGMISTFDLIHLRRLILFMDAEFQENTSWRFVDADFVFPNPENPFETAFPETHLLEGIEEELADFIAIKIGDLNLDAELNEFGGEVSDRNFGNLIFEVEEKSLKTKEQYKLDFSAKNFEQINGFQFTINFDHAVLEILDFEKADLLNLDAKNYSLAKIENGVITLSWNHDTFVDLKSDDVVFSLKVEAKSNVRLSDVLSFSSEFTKAEAYQSSGFMNVDLVFENDETISIGKPELFQNSPNPFSEESVIGFTLPEATKASLIIYDINGSILKRIERDFDVGYNEVQLLKSELSTEGVLYYQLKTKNEVLTKTMLLLD